MLACPAPHRLGTRARCNGVDLRGGRVGQVVNDAVEGFDALLHGFPALTFLPLVASVVCVRLHLIACLFHQPQGLA